ncbi:hypothetical protein [Scytonema sp. PCC 10023]|uniref:hypothetical protein n=1 Tax=Scytonema sp. PCC 10023 TaxID=1680591 RepID=UPI0039C63355
MHRVKTIHDLIKSNLTETGLEIAFASAAVLLDESRAIELLVTAQKTPNFFTTSGDRPLSGHFVRSPLYGVLPIAPLNQYGFS